MCFLQLCLALHWPHSTLLTQPCSRGSASATGVCFLSWNQGPRADAGKARKAIRRIPILDKAAAFHKQLLPVSRKAFGSDHMPCEPSANRPVCGGRRCPPQGQRGQLGRLLGRPRHPFPLAPLLSLIAFSVPLWRGRGGSSVQLCARRGAAICSARARPGRKPRSCARLVPAVPGRGHSSPGARARKLGREEEDGNHRRQILKIPCGWQLLYPQPELVSSRCLRRAAMVPAGAGSALCVLPGMEQPQHGSIEEQ